MFGKINQERLEKIKGNIGVQFKHFRTKDIYVITGWVFDADTDEFKVLYHNIQDKNVQFTRSVKEFFGMKNGVKRFEKL